MGLVQSIQETFCDYNVSLPKEDPVVIDFKGKRYNLNKIAAHVANTRSWDINIENIHDDETCEIDITKAHQTETPIIVTALSQVFFLLSGHKRVAQTRQALSNKHSTPFIQCKYIRFADMEAFIEK